MKNTKGEASIFDKDIIISILARIKKKTGTQGVKTISFPRLFKILDKREKIFVKKFLKMDPREYGLKNKFLGTPSVPKNLVLIKDQFYVVRRKRRIIEEQYVPRPVYDAYAQLNQALEKETGKKLLINSGYRSPAYQTIIFFEYLKFYGFDVSKTARRVAFPGYGEHCVPQRQALDFVTTEGIPTDERPLDFEKTPEYRWLKKNAHRFGFALSYPRKNPEGMMHEPWHWRFEKKPSSKIESGRNPR